VSNITNVLIDSIKEWQSRPFEEVYYVLWMDGISIKIRHNGKIINKTIYLVIGRTREGLKQVLGMWIAPTESASFWMSVLTDLKERGVEDILIASTDNLTGFSDAITSVFPQAITQLSSYPALQLSRSQLSRSQLPAPRSPAPQLSRSQLPSSQLPAPSSPALQLSSSQLPSSQLPAPCSPAPCSPAPCLPAIQLPAPSSPAIPLPAIQLPAPSSPALQLPAYQLPAPSSQLPALQLPAYQLPSSQLPSSQLPAPRSPLPTSYLNCIF